MHGNVHRNIHSPTSHRSQRLEWTPKAGGSKGMQCALTWWELSAMNRNQERVQTHLIQKTIIWPLVWNDRHPHPCPRSPATSPVSPGSWVRSLFCVPICPSHPIHLPPKPQNQGWPGGNQLKTSWHVAPIEHLWPVAGEAVTENHEFTDSVSCMITLLFSTHCWTFTMAEFLEALINAKWVYGTLFSAPGWLRIHL